MASTTWFSTAISFRRDVTKASVSTIRESAWNVVASFVPVVAALALTPIMIDQLGVETYGVYQSLAAVVTLTALLNFGLGPAVIRLVALHQSQPDRANAFVSTTNLLTAVTAVGTLGFLLLLSPQVRNAINPPQPLEDAAMTAMLLVAFVAAVVLVRSQGLRLLHAHHYFAIPAGIEAAVSVATLALIAMVATAGYGLVAVTAARLVVEVFAAVAVMFVLRRKLGSTILRARFVGDAVRPLAAFAPYAAVAQTVNTALTSLDRLIVAGIASAALLPLYAVPMTVSVLVSSVGARIGMALFPLAAQLDGLTGAEDRRAQLSTTYERAARLLSLYAVGGPVILAVAASDLLAVWIDPSFADDSGIAPVVAMVLTIVSVVSVAPSTFASGLGRPQITAGLAVVRIVIALVAGLVLVRERGPDGMAISLLLSAGLTVPILLWYVERRLLEQSATTTMRTYAKNVLIGVGTAAAALAIRSVVAPTSLPTVALYLAVASLAHVALILAIHPLPSADWKVLRRGLSDMFRTGPTAASDA